MTQAVNHMKRIKGILRFSHSASEFCLIFVNKYRCGVIDHVLLCCCLRLYLNLPHFKDPIGLELKDGVLSF